jgi:formate dehydrogenase accessory protein FdhE
MRTLLELEQRYPEWRPWLAGIGEVLAELESPAWEAEVPAAAPEGEGDVPLLAAAGHDAARMPVPLLHAFGRRWASHLPRGWSRGYCPVCGAWPAFAEVCGVERQRFLHCVRCGSSWRSHALSCTYCANADHEQLGTLVEDGGDARGGRSWAIETCRRCSGYLKVFTRLNVSSPAQALLEDLASVELDLAAGERGYRRPPGTGYAAVGAR